MSARAFVLIALIACSLAGVNVSLAQTSHAPAVVPDTGGKATILPNGWRVTPAGHAIALPGDLPLKMLISPDGKKLIVNTGGFHDHDVDVIDMTTQTLTQAMNVDKDWAGLAFSPDGGTLYVAAGEGEDLKTLAGNKTDGTDPVRLAGFAKSILRFGFTNDALTAMPPVPIPGLEGKEHWTGGIAADRDGSLYVADVEGEAVHKLAGAQLSVEIVGNVGYSPYAVVLSPDGKTLAVSNWGGRSVSFLDPTSMATVATVSVGQHPNEMVFARDGRLFVANAGSNSVSVIGLSPAVTDLGTTRPAGPRVIETIKTSLTPNAPVGSTPDALALSPNGKTLYVANADNNDVAVIDVSQPHESRVLGFIPTGWYPSALAVAPDGKHLFIGTGKGLSFRANYPPKTAHPEKDDGGTVNSDYIPDVLSGAVSIVALPDAKTLAHYTNQVRADVPVPASLVSPAQVKIAKTAFAKIKHVLFIIRENRTYDQVFGDLKAGNGDPHLTLFGQAVTPNAHHLAAQTVLLDNLYCNGEVSEDGHQWCNAAYATDFTEKAWVNSYSGRGEPDADERLTASPAGYLWDNCRRHGLTYRSYGEFAEFRSTPNAPPVYTGTKGLSGHASLAWAQLPFGKRRDTERAAIFIKEMHDAEKTGAWPNYMVMSLGEDHTQFFKAGAFTPIAAVASNDQALGQIAAAVSRSKFWKSTAIFVIEDDAQDGPDHVDAHRTVGLVLSPYVRRGVTDHTLYSTASFVHTMELILGLPTMTQYDAAATPLYDSFAPLPVLTAFNTLPPQVDLTARNPDKGPGAQASAKFDLSAPDRVDPAVANALLWHTLRPGQAMPAPVHSVASLP